MGTRSQRAKDHPRVFQRQCQGKCGVVSSQIRESAYDEVSGEIVARPVWKCCCCGFEEKRIVRVSAKSKKITVFLESKIKEYQQQGIN